MKKYLSIRLNTVVNLIKSNKVVADIGTDHASLPIFLVKQGLADRVYASDINEGPIKIARKNIDESGLSDRIEVFLSDGLKNVPQDAQEIVIAGMGGKLISKIIDDAPFTKDKNVGLILQPMSDAKSLRKYLYKNGYKIIKEIAFKDADHLYSAFRAEYSGECIYPDEYLCRVGKITENFGNFEREYLQREISKCKKKIEGLKKANKETEELSKEIIIKNDLENLLRSNEK